MKNLLGKFKGTRRRTAVLLVSSAIVLQGCAGAQQALLTKKYDDASDVCVAERRPVIALRSTEEQEQIRNAVAGALIGAAGGALFSIITGNKNAVRNAVIGAAIGALTGYARAYLKQKQERHKTKKALLASIDQDAVNERKVLTRSAKAIRALRDCRSRQLDAVAAKINSGALKKAKAKAAVEEIQARLEQDNRLITEVLDGAKQRTTTYINTSGAVSGVEKSLLAAERRDQKAQAARNVVQKSTPNAFKIVGAPDEIARADNVQREGISKRVRGLLIGLS